MSDQEDRIYLFSIDLEDVRLWMADGLSYKERVPANTHAYLNWLRKHQAKCTFFTVGEVAEKYPSLIGEIISEGHEIGCHTNKHIPLDKQSPVEFKRDLEQNMEYLVKAGAKNIKGFRAPIFSLTEKTSWAFKILEELQFTYSSSVLPAKNPLYGWKGFGSAPKKISDKLVEIPMSVGKIGPLTIPYGGGTYFRVLPSSVIMKRIDAHKKASDPLLGYFHPYDIDTEQERFMHPGINNSRFYNMLMYYNRGKMFEKLDRVLSRGFRICTYHEYVTEILKS